MVWYPMYRSSLPIPSSDSLVFTTSLGNYQCIEIVNKSEEEYDKYSRLDMKLFLENQPKNGTSNAKYKQVIFKKKRELDFRECDETTKIILSNVAIGVGYSVARFTINQQLLNTIIAVGVQIPQSVDTTKIERSSRLLMTACRYGRKKTIKQLQLLNSTTIKYKSNLNETPLQAAVKSGSLALVKYFFIQKNMPLNSNEMENILDIALCLNYWDIVKYLVTSPQTKQLLNESWERLLRQKSIQSVAQFLARLAHLNIFDNIFKPNTRPPIVNEMLAFAKIWQKIKQGIPYNGFKNTLIINLSSLTTTDEVDEEKFFLEAFTKILHVEPADVNYGDNEVDDPQKENWFIAMQNMLDYVIQPRKSLLVKDWDF